MRNSSRWLPLLAVLLMAFAGGSVVAGQEETESGEEPLADESFLESEPRPEIDEILFDDMEVLAGEGETYDPGDRRDPFLSLLEEPMNVEEACTEVGIPCLKIGDIEVTGIFITGTGAVAQIRGADDRKSFLIRQGDQLFDGEVTSIAFDEVVFRQRTDEGLKPFQPVVKKLKPQGGKGS